VNQDSNTELFPEFDAACGFHANPDIHPTMRDDYQSELNHHLNTFVTGHLQYGGYHASPSHCRRYLSEMWEAGEFALEEHVQAGTIGALPDDDYECFSVQGRLWRRKEYSFRYFDQLASHLRSKRGIPIFDLYMTPIERAYRNARENLLKFRRLVIEMVAITVLLVSMMLYGAFFLSWNADEAAVSNGLVNAGFFVYLLVLFLLVPILIFFQEAHKDDSSTFRLFYHPFVLSLITMLCILSAVFGLRVFGVVKSWLITLTYWIPFAFYLLYYILDGFYVYAESRKIKYQRAWRREYAKIYEQEHEKPLRYIEFRINWWKCIHKLPVLPPALMMMRASFNRYTRFYHWCVSDNNKQSFQESDSPVYNDIE